MRLFTWVTPSRLHKVMGMPDLNFPRVSFPMAIRPMYEEYSSDVIIICGVPSAASGSGMSSMMASSNGVMSDVRSRQSVDIHPSFALP